MMARESLARALTQHFPDLRIVGMTGSVRETVAWLREPDNLADVIFMDVELADGDCFEIFRQIDIAARVIMTTAYDRYAVRAFEVNSIDYLLKPIDPAALKRAVERCRAGAPGVDTARLLEAIRTPRSYKQRYVVRFNDRIVPVRTSDIAYFYSEEKNTYLVTAGRKPLCHGSLARYPLRGARRKVLFPYFEKLHRLDDGDLQRGEVSGKPSEDHCAAPARI